jgi:hypothetical protein
MPGTFAKKQWVQVPEKMLARRKEELYFGLRPVTETI